MPAEKPAPDCSPPAAMMPAHRGGEPLMRRDPFAFAEMAAHRRAASGVRANIRFRRTDGGAPNDRRRIDARCRGRADNHRRARWRSDGRHARRWRRLKHDVARPAARERDRAAERAGLDHGERAGLRVVAGEQDRDGVGQTAGPVARIAGKAALVRQVKADAGAAEIERAGEAQRSAAAAGGGAVAQAPSTSAARLNDATRNIARPRFQPQRASYQINRWLSTVFGYAFALGAAERRRLDIPPPKGEGGR